MKKLPSWTHHFVMPLLLTMFMTAIVSGISTFRVAGTAGLITNWVGSWLWSWAVAFPALLVIMPLVRKIVFHCVEEPQASKAPNS